VLFFSGKLSNFPEKMLRKDRTAANVNVSPGGDPPQAENLACEILCSIKKETSNLFRPEGFTQ